MNLFPSMNRVAIIVNGLSSQVILFMFDLVENNFTFGCFAFWYFCKILKSLIPCFYCFYYYYYYKTSDLKRSTSVFSWNYWTVDYLIWTSYLHYLHINQKHAQTFPHSTELREKNRIKMLSIKYTDVSLQAIK